MPDRRRFLAAAGALGAVVMAPVVSGAQPRPGSGYLSARLDAAGQPRATLFSIAGEVLFDQSLPARGHGAAWSPTRGELVMVSRRPGTYLLILDAADGRVLHSVRAAPERYFNGHAVFAGGRLYATETVVADDPPSSGNGVVGIYDPVAGYRRVGEFATHGHDPHQLLALGDQALVVANGGLLTHPDAPGVKLNLDSMDSSLAWIDARDGRLLAIRRLDPALAQLSLRHLALARDGTIAVVMQHEGPSTERVPLIALHRPGSAGLEPIELPEPMLSRLRNYCGSVAFDRSGRVLGASSPRGGTTVFWDLDAARAIGEVAVADGCGVAPGARAGEFLISSGLGGVRRVDSVGVERLSADARLDDSQWDNHLLDIVVRPA